MKFRATIDFDIADDYMKDVYKDSMECLSDEFENFFKHIVITNFGKFFDEKIATEFGIENECKCYYRGTDIKELKKKKRLQITTNTAVMKKILFNVIISRNQRSVYVIR